MDENDIRSIRFYVGLKKTNLALGKVQNFFNGVPEDQSKFNWRDLNRSIDSVKNILATALKVQ